MNRVRSVIPFPGSPHGATAAALAARSAAADHAPKRQRSATIAELSSQAGWPVATLKMRRGFDMTGVNSDDAIHLRARSPFNVYPEGVPAPLGFFFTSLALACLLAGTVLAGCVLLGVV